jgi:hypothetical protein
MSQTLNPFVINTALSRGQLYRIWHIIWSIFVLSTKAWELLRPGRGMWPIYEEHMGVARWPSSPLGIDVLQRHDGFVQVRTSRSLGIW